MSQQQLAGADYSRSFICRIERGQVSPSLTTLQVLARRLDKPLEYFTAEAGDREETAKAVQALLREAERALADRQLEKALEAAHGAVRFSQQMARLEQEVQARLLLLRVYVELRHLHKAMELGEELLEQSRTLQLTPVTAELYLHLGSILFSQDQFAAAKRYLLRGLKVTEERKRLVGIQARLLITLGSVCTRLCDTVGATGYYQKALACCDRGVEPELPGLARMGLGWALFSQGDLRGSWRLTMEARELLEGQGHPSAIQARQNLAVIAGALEQWDEAVRLLVDCLKHYRRENAYRLQAAVLELLANYYVAHAQWENAGQACDQAFRALEREDDFYLRARLYRVAARMAHGRGAHERAQDLAMFSLTLFRQLQAQDEVNHTQDLLQDWNLTGVLA